MAVRRTTSRSLPVPARRHPKWNDVPDDQWDDWRWQMQNAIRTPLNWPSSISFGPQELAALEELEQKYKLAIPPYYFSLIDTARSARSDRACNRCPSPLEAGEHVGRRAGRSAGRGQGLARARADASLSRPRADGHDARLHDVLPVLHAQARDHGPRRLGRPQPQRRADDRSTSATTARFAT